MSTPVEYVDERELRDGTTLRLVSWISSDVRPGQKMYRLELNVGDSKMSFPEDFENHTEEEMRLRYKAIQSYEDFLRIMPQPAEK